MKYRGVALLLASASIIAHAGADGKHPDRARLDEVRAEGSRWAAREGVSGTVVAYAQFPSRHVAARNVDIWLPSGYDRDRAARYPVVYVHDGQNLFDPKLSYTGVDWGIDEAMTRLVAAGDARAAIVVGIWNTPQRFGEYMPEDAVHGAQVTMLDGVPPVPRSDIVSNAYLDFIVDELKPFVDAHYRTRPGRDDTFVMGSSMGGLISAYAVAKRPDVFGGAACLSTHWPAGDGASLDWLAKHLPDPAGHRFYFDHGTATLDAAYAPLQARMDEAMAAHGYVRGTHWQSRVFTGAEHSERAWRARVETPLRFLLASGRSSRDTARGH